MGNILGGSSAGSNIVTLNDTNTLSESEIMEDISGLHDNDENTEEFYDSVEDYQDARNKRKEEKLNEFKKQLSVKREQRRNILDRHKTEKKNLEDALIEEKKSKLELLKQNKILQELLQKNNIEIPETCQPSTEYGEFLQIIDKMHEEVDKLKANNNSLRLDLANSNKALQEANTDIAELNFQNTESKKQISALKEVISVTKTMINLRENQLLELKNKLNEIEKSLADREANMLSTDLRQEYERQLNNIRTLRGLYEERARLAEVTKQALVRDLDEQKLLLQVEVKKNEDLNNKVQELENNVNKLEDTVNDKNNIIASCKEECRGLQSEMSVVNKVLLGYKSKKDLDKLVTRLEENHGILTHMVEKENGSEASSALPKLLLELVGQVEENETSIPGKSQDINISLSEGNESTETKATVGKAEEIVQNLPKVWRVLMELLSHQSEAETNSSEKVTTCYKPVQTKSGTVLVPSVSQTYIRLKDLILEKLALIKEVNRMKQLNTHLESRLHEQEKRLCSVTNELGKTWHVVGRLRRHHQQLHTHEKILKYELQQKRKLLNELKEELEYCREKWEQAREKNNQSEQDWKKLRIEFSNRKLDSTSHNNSAESGYSDERPSDESSESNDESEYLTDQKIKYKKKIKKVFETALDSSTDLNMAAERDDPVSDMLDVADLSLDTQDDNLETFEQFDSCNSENLVKSDRIADTEDECADLSQDTSLQETSFSKKYEDKEHAINANSLLNKTSNQVTDDYNNASSSTNMNLREQDSVIKNNEIKDERHSGNDTSAISAINKSQSVLKLSEIINKKLHNITNRAHDEDQENKTLAHFDSSENSGAVNTEASTVIAVDKENNRGKISEHSANTSVTESPLEKQTIVEVDFKAILENVKRQDEKLRQKEKRLQSLEQSCSNVVSDLSSTLQAGNAMISKLDSLNSERNRSQNVTEDSEISKLDTLNSEHNRERKEDTDESNVLQDRDNIENEPSTSSEIDHEARFAARDIRLKRLEEQTKSLVNKVNKTATKGIKINYKLEELHNIYGSDNSRSGTPSDDTEDISQKTDDASTEE